MTAWLLAHQVQLQTDLQLGSFGIIAVWESLAARRAERTSFGTRWLINLALVALGMVLSRLCVPVAAIVVAALAEQRGWGLLNRATLPPWSLWVIGVIILDLANYGTHRLFHAVPLFWRFHRIHHSDLDVDCGTAIRHHPFEILTSLASDLAIIWAFGISPVAILLSAVLTGIASAFNHGNVALPAAADLLLRRFVVTPDMHRVHHSADVEESNRNYAALLPCWDHLFATYQHQPRLGHDGMALGIAEAQTTDDVTLLRLLALPFRPVSAVRLPEAPDGTLVRW